MDKRKIVLLLIACILLVSGASSLLYKVDVDASLNHSSFDLNYRNTTDTLQVVSSSVTNTGSVGCTYRLRADIQRNTTDITHYSRGYELWPGETAAMKLRFISGNATGQIPVQIHLQYCGQEENLEEFTFQNTKSEQVNGTIDSRTTEATDTGAKATFSVSRGVLVPLDTPPYWKVSSADINESEANIDYEPTLFRSEEEIEFAVLNKSNENVVGRTTVELEPQTSLLNEIRQKLDILLLATSLLVNIALVALLFRTRIK